MNKTTRQRILEVIERRGLVSAAEIARLLGLTPADVRHHLKALRDEGVVVIVASKLNAGEVKPGMGMPGLQEKTGPGAGHSRGRGRPTHLYAPAASARRHNLDGLSAALLTRLAHSLPAAERQTALEQVAAELGGEPSSPEASLARRLTRAVQRLNELGYAARWEASPQAPRLRLGHCPYRAIIAAHPELCHMDAALLARLAGAQVTQVEKLAQDAGGLPHCLFLVQPSAAPP